MGKDKLAELREEWYSDPNEQPETEEDVVDDEFLALNVLFKSRGVTVSGDESVKVDDTDSDNEDSSPPADTGE